MLETPPAPETNERKQLLSQREQSCVEEIRAIQLRMETEGESDPLLSALKEAQEKLWILVTPLTNCVVRDYKHACKIALMEPSDLQGEIAVVFPRIIEGYRADRGLFGEYFATAARRRIQHVLEAKTSLIRIPSYAQQKIRKATGAFRADHDGRNPDPEELGPYGVTAEDLERISIARNVQSGSLQHSEYRTSVESGFRDRRGKRPDEIAQERELQGELGEDVKAIIDSVKRLSPREEGIFRAYFGIGTDGSLGEQRLTFRAIGATLGISRSRVHIIVQGAVQQIRDWLGSSPPKQPVPAAAESSRTESSMDIPSGPVITAGPVSAPVFPAPAEGAQEVTPLLTEVQHDQILEFIRRAILRNDDPEKRRRAVERLRASLGKHAGEPGPRPQGTTPDAVESSRPGLTHPAPEDVLSDPSAMLDGILHQLSGGCVPRDILPSVAYSVASAPDAHADDAGIAPSDSPPCWLPLSLRSRWSDNPLDTDERAALAILFAFTSESCKAALTACFPQDRLAQLIAGLNAGLLRQEYVIRDSNGVIGIVRSQKPA